MITFSICFVVLVAAYFLYGSFLEYTVGVDDKADMPSKTHYDGVSEFTFVDTPDGLRFICEDGSYTLVTYTGDSDTVTLPATINGSAYTIDHLENVKHLIFSEGITAISDRALEDCTTLVSISLPSTLTTIGQDAFSACTSLETIRIADLEQWFNTEHTNEFSWTFSYPYDLYLGDELLTELVIPESVTALRDSCFYNCRSIQKVHFHEGLTSIGNYNCSHCTCQTCGNNLWVGRCFQGCFPKIHTFLVLLL